MVGDTRQQALQDAISRHVVRGAIVISQGQYEAVVSYPGQRVNHVLHAIITIFTCLIWGIVWAVMAGTAQKERRIRITVLPGGEVREEEFRID